MTTGQRIDDIVAGNAIRHADRPALRDGERAITYRELEADVERAAATRNVKALMEVIGRATRLPLRSDGKSR